jgi:hypothetical protein
VVACAGRVVETDGVIIMPDWVHEDAEDDADREEESKPEDTTHHPLAQMFSQRMLLAEFDLPASPADWAAPPPPPPAPGPCPAPEPELPLGAAAGRVSPVSPWDDGPSASLPNWAAVTTTSASAEELALGTALIALGESTRTAASQAMDGLPFTLLTGRTDLLGGRLMTSNANGCADLVSLETTEGFLRLAANNHSPPVTPEHGSHDGWTNQTGSRGRTRVSPSRSGPPAHTATEYNRYAALASLSAEDLPADKSTDPPVASPGRPIPRYTAVSPDRSPNRRRPRGSTGSVSSVEDEVDLPPAHFVSSTETMSQIFSLPYMDSEVSIVLHRVGGMLVMEGTLNGSDLGSGSVSTAGIGSGRGRKAAADARQEEAELASNFLFFSSANGEGTATGGGRSLHSKGAHSATPAAAGAAPGAETGSSGTFRHKFMWEFEDYGLLLGSDMIVFSNAKHPKFSMQLHDVDQEVSSLACLELWMNNVFQSVPETGICCHKDGFVQGYKLMKTNELPTLSNTAPGSQGASFQPAAVMENGASILKFLHTNCERDGATYWLHRNASDGSLQLFEVPLGAEVQKEPRTGGDDSASQQPSRDRAARDEQEEQMSVSVATLVFRMAERFADEDGDQYGSAQGSIGERRLRLYRRCVELIDVASAPQLWAAATERIGEFNLNLLSSLNALTLHAARRISTTREQAAAGHRSSALVAKAVEALGQLCAARDACATLGSHHTQHPAVGSTGSSNNDEAAQSEKTVRRLTLRLAHICLWLGNQCLTVGCDRPPTESRGQAETEPTSRVEPDIGAGLHQLALASWLLQQIDVPAEPSNADAEGRQHVVALLALTGRAFAELAQAGVRGVQLKAAAGPAVVKLAAAQAAAGLRGDDATRFSVASILGMDSETVEAATSSGGWLGQHVHAAAVVPGMDAEQNFNQAVQFLLRALRLCAPGPGPAAGSGSSSGVGTGPSASAPARTAPDGVQEMRAEHPGADREDGGKKRTAPFTGGGGVSTASRAKELVVVPGQGRGDSGDDSESVGSAISAALGGVYHALGDHYTATGRRTKAHRHCQQGIALFNSISDRPNTARCMAAIGRIVRSGAVETDSERSFSSAAVDVYTSALSWHRQAREMLLPRSTYPRTWRKLRPDLAATAAASAALLQAQLPQLADKQRVEAELETLSALGDAISVYREMLAEAEGSASTAASAATAWLGGNESALGTAGGSKLAAKLGDLEHQLGLFHGWRATTAAPAAEDARGTRLRKLALAQAEKHLSEGVRWLLLSAAGPTCNSDPVPPALDVYPQADVAALRKQMVGQLDSMQANGGGGGDDKAEAAAFKRIVQLSVRASVEVSRLAQSAPVGAQQRQLPTGVELIRRTSAS